MKLVVVEPDLAAKMVPLTSRATPTARTVLVKDFQQCIPRPYGRELSSRPSNVGKGLASTFRPRGFMSVHGQYQRKGQALHERAEKFEAIRASGIITKTEPAGSIASRGSHYTVRAGRRTSPYSAGFVYKAM